MIKFLSIWGAMLLENQKQIYLICTGLSKNIEDFAREPNITFFKRSDLINTDKRGYLQIDLPRFGHYVLLWHSEEF